MPAADVDVATRPTTGEARRGRAATWGTLGTGVALCTAQATTAIAFVVLARRSTTDAFGSYAGLYAASLAVGTLLDFGSSQYRTRELAKGVGHRHVQWWLRRRSLIQMPGIAAFGLAALVLVSDHLPVACTVALVTQALTYNLSHGTLAAVRAVRTPLAAEWLIAAGNLVLLVACVASPSKWLLVGAGIGAAGSWLLTAAIGLVLTRPHVGDDPLPPGSRNPWTGSVSFGVTGIAASVQGFAIAAIGWTSGTDDAALIGAVNKWGQPIALLAAAYATSMFPSFARADSDRQAVRLLRPLRTIVAVGVAVAVGLILVSSLLVDLLLGARYDGADAILRLLLLAAVPVLVAQPLSALLQARGADRFVARWFAATALAVFGLTVAGSAAIGAASVPLASLLGSCALLAVFARRVRAMGGDGLRAGEPTARRR